MRRKRRKQSITAKRRKWRKIKGNQYFQGVLRHDKNIICVPRHSSFMIMNTFADWGNTGQNMEESIGITTV